LLSLFLWWASGAVDWVALRAESLKRIGLFTGCLLAAAAVYLGAVSVAGLKLRQFLRR
jgi:putative peptidoglycan lipid II flippase